MPPTGPTYAGFIDAGFLKAEGRKARGMSSSARVAVAAAELVEWLDVLSARYPNDLGSFLRAYWYDGAHDPRDPRYGAQRRYFDAIAATPGVQVRLGHLQERDPRWQHAIKKAIEACGVELAEFERHFTFRPEQYQKGVDSLIVLDLVRLAERRAYDVAVLIAGDRDIAPAVRAVQDAGAKVIVAHPEGAGVATELRQLADHVEPIDADSLSRIVLESSSRATRD